MHVAPNKRALVAPRSHRAETHSEDTHSINRAHGSHSRLRTIDVSPVLIVLLRQSAKPNQGLLDTIDTHAPPPPPPPLMLLTSMPEDRFQCLDEAFCWELAWVTNTNHISTHCLCGWLTDWLVVRLWQRKGLLCENHFTANCHLLWHYQWRQSFLCLAKMSHLSRHTRVHMSESYSRAHQHTHTLIECIL